MVIPSPGRSGMINTYAITPPIAPIKPLAAKVPESFLISLALFENEVIEFIIFPYAAPR